MFHRGDKVRLTKDTRDIRMPWLFEAGETGTLGKLYRVQDGVEVWQCYLDKKREFAAPIPGLSQPIIAVFHTDIEKL